MSDVIVEHSMDLTPAFATTQNLKEVRCFKKASFKGLKESLCDLVKNQRKVPRENASKIIRSISVETIQEMSEITWL